MRAPVPAALPAPVAAVLRESVLAPAGTVWVDATLQGKTVLAPPGRPVAVPAAELPNHGDPSAWLLLVLPFLAPALRLHVEAVTEHGSWGWQPYHWRLTIVPGLAWLVLVPFLMLGGVQRWAIFANQPGVGMAEAFGRVLERALAVERRAYVGGRCRSA